MIMKVAPSRFALLFLLVVAGLGAGGLRADVIETKDGTHLVGHVTKIADGKVYVATDFAGDIVVLQSHIVRLSTDKPVAVRLMSGRRYDGTLSTSQDVVQVATASGPVTTSVPEIAASWPAGQPDPQSIRPQYHWVYEASVNVTGKEGNHRQFGGAYGVRATLKRLKDTLILSSSYNRQTSDGAKSADQAKVGADYADNYSDRNSWYVRDTVGFDRVKDLTLYNTAAVGAGYDLVKQVHQTLTVRAGLAHRYEQYADHTAPQVSALGLDLEVNHTLQFSGSLLTTKVAVVPEFDRFSDIILTQETDYDIPLTKSNWKVRLGFANNFVSNPPAGIKQLDTTYFGSLVWDFERFNLRGVVRRAVWWK
jgi:Protein of unknown function, DUF481